MRFAIVVTMLYTARNPAMMGAGLALGNPGAPVNVPHRRRAITRGRALLPSMIVVLLIVSFLPRTSDKGRMLPL